VWNYYHRVRRGLRVNEATATWTYTTLTFRQANTAAGNQVDCVVGVADVLLDVRVTASAQNTTTGVNVFVAIGEDSTTTPATGLQAPFTQTALANGPLPVSAQLVKYPAIGRHFYAWLEASAATGTTTWYGTAAGGIQSGLQGWIEG
jgi:hypothetical protein